MEIVHNTSLTGVANCNMCGETINYCPGCGRPLEVTLEGSCAVEYDESEYEPDENRG
mgnify:FL=1